MRFGRGIRRVFIRKHVFYIKTTYVIDTVGNVRVQTGYIVGNSIQKAIIVKPNAAGNFLIPKNEHGIEAHIFQARASKKRRFQRARAAIGKNFHSCARLDGTGNIRFLFIDGKTAKCGIESRDHTAHGVFIVADVSADFRFRAPFFQLFHHFRLEFSTVGKPRTNERRKLFGVSVRALPKIKRQSRDGKFRACKHPLVLSKHHFNPLCLNFFYVRKIKRR